MTPLVLRTVRGMIADTFRQSLASKLFWGMFAITAVAVLLCLSISVEGDTARKQLDYDTTGMIPASEVKKIGEKKVKADGVPIISGTISFGFGLVTEKLGRDRDDAVKFVQFILAGAIGDTVGVLLALLWTAGFLPTFLEPANATVLLAKPTPRWAILLGKYLGVVLFVALQATLFVGGTWLALGLKTGSWNFAYWLAVPLLLLNFAVFYAVSVFLAVATRNTIASLFGVLMVWLLCWGVNFAYLQPKASKAVMAMYWVLPKPADLGGSFYDAVGGESFGVKMPEWDEAQKNGRVVPEASAVTSLLFALVVLLAAAYEFKHTDY